jgi:hypothetical protein
MRTTTLLTSTASAKRRTYLLPSLAFLAMGCLLHIFAYQSLGPVAAVVIFFMLGTCLLRLPSAGGYFERIGFRLVFAIGWFMAGIAAVYANYLNDPFQNFSDAAWFFELASMNSADTSLTSIQAIQSITEGAGAVVIWRAVYDAFAVIGFEKGRYLGVLVNVTSVAFSCVFAVKIARLVYGNDTSRLNRLIFIFSMCGLFWLFAAIHLRDGLVLLGVTALSYIWTRYLEKPEIQNIVFLVAATIFAFAFFGLLRTEFLFVPLAMLVGGLAASLMFSKSRGSIKVITYILALIGMVITGVVFSNLQEELLSSLIRGNEGYSEAAGLRGSSDSLGMALIVNQPILLRLILGSAYLFIFPIPVWAGFQLESAYHLFKSLNVLFFYALIPLIALSLLRIARDKAVRTPSLMFLLFIVIGFTLAIAGTSLEGRHFGAFLVPVLVLALLPDLTLKKYRHIYKVYLVIFISMMAMLHFVWLVIKL